MQNGWSQAVRRGVTCGCGWFVCLFWRPLRTCVCALLTFDHACEVRPTMAVFAFVVVQATLCVVFNLHLSVEIRASIRLRVSGGSCCNEEWVPQKDSHLASAVRNRMLFSNDPKNSALKLRACNLSGLRYCSPLLHSVAGIERRRCWFMRLFQRVSCSPAVHILV